MPQAVPKPLIPRAFRCRCGRPVFFGNSQCLACGTALGYDPVRGLVLPIEPAQPEGHWRAVGGRRSKRAYRRCSNLGSPAACNWLFESTDRYAGTPPLCRCCRLNRMLPDLSVPENAVYWRRIAQAQRRLVSTLIGLGLPVKSRLSEDTRQGLAFDLLHALPGGPAVITGHADGIITLDVQEADDAHREQRRNELREPYRTLLGHLRHETGHYYWQRLVERGIWLEPFRALFGDERQDYAGALQAHYRDGPPADWRARHVSAYASSHPWEDWAETWAHYLHLRDTLDTARSFGVDGESVELSYERFGPEALGEAGAQDPEAAAFLALVNGWMELTGVLNELSRSMGIGDFYPFVLSAPALRKLHLVHRVVGAPVAGSEPGR
jgi:hypothetical protein